MEITCASLTCVVGRFGQRAHASQQCWFCKDWFCGTCARDHRCVQQQVRQIQAEQAASSDFNLSEELSLLPCRQAPQPGLDFGFGVWNLHKLGKSSDGNKKQKIIGGIGDLFAYNPWLEALALVEVQKTGIEVLLEALPALGLRLLSGPLLMGRTPLSDKEINKSLEARKADFAKIANEARPSQEEVGALLAEIRRLSGMLDGSHLRTLRERYTEYYPLVVRQDSSLFLEGIELYWQDGRVTRYLHQEPAVTFRGPEMIDSGWYREGTSYDDMCRPIITYVCKKSDRQGGSKRIKIGVVHTSPDGDEFRRVKIFQEQIQRVFARVDAELARDADLYWVLGGDYYLTPQARVLGQAAVPGGSQALNQEKQNFMAELHEGGWVRDGAGSRFQKTISFGEVSRTVTVEVSIESVRNVLRLTFEHNLPTRLVLAVPLTATLVGDEHKWTKVIAQGEVDLKEQVADFMVCSRNWTVRAAGVFKDPELMRDSGGGLVVLDGSSMILYTWSQISDHTPVGTFLGNYREAEVLGREILGYDRRTLDLARHTLESIQSVIEFDLLLKEDHLQHTLALSSELDEHSALLHEPWVALLNEKIRALRAQGEAFSTFNVYDFGRQHRPDRRIPTTGSGRVEKKSTKRAPARGGGGAAHGRRRDESKGEND